MRSVHAAVLVITVVIGSAAKPADDKHPLSFQERSAIESKFRQVLKDYPQKSDEAPGSVAHHSRRGDALYFLGRFREAVAEYQAMVRIDPQQDASHWRLGIALFFDDKHSQAAAQFDKYHVFDDVDRENGIWRFLSHHKAFGAKRAARELLRYQKDDREPFPVVYRLFDGGVTAEQAVQMIPDELAEVERDKRLFYTQLYVGMLASVQGDSDAAQSALHAAVSCQWPRGAGFGPNYMWHVARLEYNRLAAGRDVPAEP